MLSQFHYYLQLISFFTLVKISNIFVPHILMSNMSLMMSLIMYGNRITYVVLEVKMIEEKVITTRQSSCSISQ